MGRRWQESRAELTTQAAAVPLAVVTQLAGKSANGVAINSRVFAPGVGIDEDPVVSRARTTLPLTDARQTGSAHTALIHYFLRTPDASARVAALAGVSQASVESVVIDAAQVSPRGGEIRAQIVDGRTSLVGKGWRWGYGQLEVLPQ